jgi:hypothetical protein
MTRRQFVYSTGAVFTASVIGTQFLNFSNESEKNRRPNPFLFDKAALQAIAFGMSAPNPHNTQAWKFELLSEESFLLFVDEERILPFTDPTTRQIHIGCGCFLEYARIGMSSLRYEVQIELFPQGAYTKEQVGQLAVAKVDLIKNKEVKADDLVSYLMARRTSRLGYKQEEVGGEVFKKLMNESSLKYSTLLLLDKESNLAKAKSMCIAGMEVETNTFRTHDESREWFRENDQLIAQKRDGINLPGGGTTGLIKWIAEMQFRNLDRKKWHDPKLKRQFLKSYKKKVVNTPHLIALKTSQNDPIDWVRGGMDYVRFQLTCTANGLSIHPMSQVLQEYKEMDDLRRQFEELMNVKVKGEEKIQMLVRVGYSKEAFYSYRRRINDLKMGKFST